MNNKEKTAAIIVAAGESQRMGGIDKVMADLGGRPLLARTVQVFQDCPLVDRIVVVVNASREAACRELFSGVEWSKMSDICLGGRRRQDSVAAGLKCLAPVDWVIIHDGVRPFISADMISRGLEAARETGAAIAAVPVTDTIKMAGDDKMVVGTPPRQKLWAVQTPQVFRHSLITEAYRRITEDVTDDASLLERAGHRVKIYPGADDNIKVTTPNDLALAKIIWRNHHDS